MMMMMMMMIKGDEEIKRPVEPVSSIINKDKTHYEREKVREGEREREREREREILFLTPY